MLYAVYQILLLHTFPNTGQSIGSWLSFLCLFYGVRGAWCVVVSIVSFGGYKMAGVGIEFGDFPSETEVVVMVGGVVCMWIYLLICVVTWVRFSPSWVAMAMTFQIPISLAIDSAFNEFHMSIVTMLKIGFVCKDEINHIVPVS